MSGHLQKIAPDQLQPGMYIEELDRPWLETPLKFQGFRVSSENEIVWIRENCRYVLVDMGRSDSEEIVIDSSQTGTFERPKAGKHSELEHSLRQVMRPAARPVTHVEKVIPAAGAAPRPAEPRKRRWLGWLSRPARPADSAPPVTTVTSVTHHEKFKTEVASANRTYEQAKQILGGVMDNLRAGGALDIAAVEHAVTPVIDSVLQSTDAMACVMRLKEWDDYTYTHSLATSIWAVVFGKSLGLDRQNLQLLGQGGLLLDVGKTRIAKALLDHEGPLTADERAELRRHVDYGVEILSAGKAVDPKVELMVRTHHERHDGSGYPQGLSGQAIPLFGRIAGLVDTYDAMTSHRPGAPAQSTYAVMRQLNDKADVLFQAELIERFIRVVGVFPTASLVELNTGEVGIVVEQNALRRLRPKVMLVLNANKQLRNEFPVVDLCEMPGDASEPGGVWILHGLEPGAYGVDPREYYL